MAWDDPAALLARLRDHLGAGANAPVDVLTRCVQASVALVGREIGTATVPDAVAAQAATEVAAELWNRRSAPGGVMTSWGDEQATVPVRIARDAMIAARPLLAPWLPLGFA